MNHILPRSLPGRCGFFGKCLSTDGKRRAVGVTGINEPLGEQARAAGCLIVGRNVFSRRSQRADIRSALGDDVEIVDGKLDAYLARNGQKMQYCIFEPPLAATLAMVFSMDLRVMICEGRRLARTASISMRPASRVAEYLSALVAGTPES
jgi:hypothetical protein